MAIKRVRTKLKDKEEELFIQWFRERAEIAGIDPNPDHALHKYDYRGAFKSGQDPLLAKGFHWPSEFKDDDHPNRFVKTRDGRILDSKRSEIIDGRELRRRKK